MYAGTVGGDSFWCFVFAADWFTSYSSGTFHSAERQTPLESASHSLLLKEKFASLNFLNKTEDTEKSRFESISYLQRSSKYLVKMLA